MNSIYLPNDSQLRKSRARSYFYEIPCKRSFLIFLAKTLIWNKIMFPTSNLLNLAELVLNETMKSISKNIYLIGKLVFLFLFDLSLFNVKIVSKVRQYFIDYERQFTWKR